MSILGGLSDSIILGNNKTFLSLLSGWLKPVAQSKSSKWKRCWRASLDGWAGTTFHTLCDSKGQLLPLSELAISTSLADTLASRGVSEFSD